MNVAQQDRQQRDEHRAEERAGDAAEAADDDHRQVLDRQAQLKLLEVDRLAEMAEQRGGDARVERAEPEGQQLVAGNVDADHRGSDVLVADSDQGAPDPGAQHVFGEHHGDDSQGEEHEVVRAVVGEAGGP